MFEPSSKGRSRILGNKPLMIGLICLAAAFLLSLHAVLPRIHRYSGGDAHEKITGQYYVPLDDLSSFGVESGGLWGNMTVRLSTASVLLFNFSYVNGTQSYRQFFLEPGVARRVEIYGFIPIGMSIETVGPADLVYTYDVEYYTYPRSFYGVIAMVLSFTGAMLSLRGAIQASSGPKTQ